MTEVILSQWVIASALGALCLGYMLFCLLPAFLIASRLRSVKGAINTLRADSAQMKESLVGDLRGILNTVAEREIEASAAHNARLGQQLTTALQAPLDSVAKSVQDFGKVQRADFSQGLQEQMSAFADRLDQLLGGQVGQAKELQQQTVNSLENTIGALHHMAKTIASTAENSSQSMVNQLRAGISRSQAETDANLKELLGKLTAQVSGAVAAIEQQSSAASAAAVEQQKKISEQAQRSIESLSVEVRSQTQAVELASQSMRTAGSDVTTAVDRIIEGMTGLIAAAAQEFMRSGQGFADILDKSNEVSLELSQTATALAASSKDIGGVVTDYRNARETLQELVDLMRTTLEVARKDSTLTGDFVARIDAAAQKLEAAQSQADNSLAKLNGVLSEAHNAFGSQMLETVRDFHDHLSKTPPEEQVSEESQRRHSEFDRMISDWVQATPRVKPAKAPPQQQPPPPPVPPPLRDTKGQERVPVRAGAPGNGLK